MSSLIVVAFLSGCSEYGLENEPPLFDIFELDVNLDIDGDGVPDLNIDVDGDGVPDVNLDIDEDGVPDLNIDVDGDGVPDVNIDVDLDGDPDVNIDIDDDGIPDINIDTNGDLDPDINVDLDGDLDPDINIDIDGDLLPDENLLDEFVVPDVTDVDIVFFGDTSGSMEEELAAVGSRIAEFTSRLQAGGGDWQLVAVNGDQGCAVDTIFTPETPDWASRFASAILVEPFDEDSDEKGLETVAKAVEQVGSGECNEGLIRPNALVHAIFLSDENDESPGFEGIDPDYWMPYADRLTAAKAGVQGLTRMSAITGPTPAGCDGSDPGWGYVQAMNGTGGTFLSICDAWENQLDVLADASVVLDRFPLSVRPDPATILVVVNAQPRPDTDWVYDGVTNSIQFVANLPAVNDQIAVRYEAL